MVKVVYPQVLSTEIQDKIASKYSNFLSASVDRKSTLQHQEDKYLRHLRSIYFMDIVLEDVFCGKHEYLQHRCNICNAHFFFKPATVLKSTANTICPRCFVPKNKISYEEYKQRLNRVHGGDIQALENPKQLCKKSLHKCNNCFNIWCTRGKDLLKGHGCPICSLHDSLINKFKYIKYKGKKYKLQGYEFEALKLLEKQGTSIETIITAQDQNKFVLKYIDRGINRFHVPDFYIPSTKTIVEVKSTYTLLISREAFRLNKLKCFVAKQQGYIYKYMLISEDGYEIKLPPLMLLMTYDSMKKYLKGKR